MMDEWHKFPKLGGVGGVCYVNLDAVVMVTDLAWEGEGTASALTLEGGGVEYVPGTAEEVFEMIAKHRKDTYGE